MCNILIVTHAFLPDLDGGIIVAYDYANLLVDLGHKVTVRIQSKVLNLHIFKYPINMVSIFGCIIMVRS